tara:strand:+ start:3224 stop:5206 length:1983 start_codon:yes stop_codon:yes gene_type:complete
MSTDKKLIGYLNTLKKEAVNQPIYDRFRKNEKYYEGKVRPQTGFNFDGVEKFGNESHYYNCIRPIIETKATIALDAAITTSIKPTSLSHANFQFLEQLESVSDILNDVWDNVKQENNLNDLQQKIMRDGLVYGIGITKTSWDPESDNGLGNVSLTRIDPNNFFADPSATTIENSNYIFTREVVSQFDLIKKYKDNPKVIKFIDELSSNPKNQLEQGTDTETNILQSYKNDEKTGQAYLSEGSITPPSPSTNITIWECYIKDTTIFEPIESDQSDTSEVKATNKFRYPNGRSICYANDRILSDTVIDFPFGFPFSIYTPNNSNRLVGNNDVTPLISTQDRLTTAYFKLNELISKYKSFLLASPDSINPADLAKNFDIVTMKRGASQPPILINNKLTADISLMRQHIDDLKKDALSIARINEVLLSGERPVGTNSGAMLAQLIESPMASIRELQKNFKEFLVNMSNKAITLIQLYYTQPRILRLSGQRFAVMHEDSQNIEVVDQSKPNESVLIPQMLLNDLSLTQYECEVMAGSSLPQSPQAIANITMELSKQGVFGDPNSISVKTIILKSLDYPNWRSIIDRIKKEQENIMTEPPPPAQFDSYLKNISLNLGDVLDLVGTLSPEVQEAALYRISDSLGITDGDPDLQQPPMPEEGIELSFN